MALSEIGLRLKAYGSNDARAALDKVTKGVGGLDKSAVLATKGLSSMLGVFAGGAAIGAAVRGFTSLTKSLDDVAKKSQQVGLSTEGFSTLVYQADLANVSVENLEVALSGFSKILAEVDKGGTKGAKVLQALGVTAEQGTMPAIYKVADAFAAMEDGVEKTAVAQALFEESGRKLIPLLNQGSAGLREQADEAARLGLVLDKETSEAASRLNSNMTRLTACLLYTSDAADDSIRV